MPDATHASVVRRFGAFEINLPLGELRKNGMRLRLSGQPFQILAILTQRPGELVTREELHSKLWPADTFVDFDHGLNNAVARIREILDDSSETPRYIETIPRRGYRFIAPLSDIRPSTPSATTTESRSVQIGSPPVTPSALPRRLHPIRVKVLLGGVLLVTILAIGLGSSLYRKRAESAPIKSLAVLPLTNLSADSGQDYLADGITEELIGQLAAIHDLRVISRTSVMRFKGSKEAVPDIAKTLGVDAIVEGSVIRDGNRIRVHAQLIRATTDEHFWSETYDRELQDILTLESDVAQSIAKKVEVTVTREERERLAEARSVLPEVYESYLKGRFALDNSNGRADTERSIPYFETAIHTDPTFAPAYLGLASAYQNLSTIFTGERPHQDAHPKELAAIHEALELNPQSVDAHVMLAEIEQEQWHWAESEAEYRRALELNPNSAAAQLAFAGWLLCQGRTEEALSRAQHARDLDPLAISGQDIAGFLFFSRRYDEEIREVRSVLALTPDDTAALWYLGYALIAKGQPEQAIAPLEKAVSISNGSPGVTGVLIRAYAHAGRRRDALRLLAELQRRRQVGYVPAGAFINAYLGLGDNEQAFVWLEKGYQEQSNILMFLKVHPHFDPLRNDPRFVGLVDRVGLDHTD